MFRCEVCGRQSQPGEPRHSHYLRRTTDGGRGRPVGSIEKEAKVCSRCHARLNSGSESFAEMTQPRRATTRRSRLYRMVGGC